MIGQTVSNLVDDYNAKMANGTSFMQNIFDPRYPLNLTTTLPPQADPQNKLITLNFDGTFYDTVHRTNYVKTNTLNPSRLSNTKNSN
jgi:hypothetical protein